MKEGTGKGRMRANSDPLRTDSAPAANKPIRRAIIVLTVFLLQWLLWGVWQTFAAPKLPGGIAMTLLESVAMKALFWAVPLIPILRRFKEESMLTPNGLFGTKFPWFACIVLLCMTTAFLYTIRLANGLVNTHAIFDPMFVVFSLSAGVIEEFAFRGVIFNLQEPAIGFWPAALLNGAVFTLYHYPGLLFGESWMQLISWRGLLIFTMGVVFCRMLKKWRNLALNMTVHTVWDILSYLFCIAG